MGGNKSSCSNHEIPPNSWNLKKENSTTKLRTKPPKNTFKLINSNFRNYAQTNFLLGISTLKENACSEDNEKQSQKDGSLFVILIGQETSEHREEETKLISPKASVQMEAKPSSKLQGPVRWVQNRTTRSLHLWSPSLSAGGKRWAAIRITQPEPFLAAAFINMLQLSRMIASDKGQTYSSDRDVLTSLCCL